VQASAQPQEEAAASRKKKLQPAAEAAAVARRTAGPVGVSAACGVYAKARKMAAKAVANADESRRENVTNSSS